MRKVFSEPDPRATDDELVGIALGASLGILVTQECETDWTVVPRLLDPIHDPTLVIGGDRDLTTPLLMGRALADALPNASTCADPYARVLPRQYREPRERWTTTNDQQW
jgi:pimeloyl-ACP methyl ester carboxylesterase